MSPGPQTSRLHRHDADLYPLRCRLIDEQVCLRPTIHGGEGHFRKRDDGELGPIAEHPAGFIIAHYRDDQPDAPWCEGSVSTDPHFDQVWTQTGSLENGDLTLSPSVLCATDGFHGFVRDGRWVPA